MINQHSYFDDSYFLKIMQQCNFLFLPIIYYICSIIYRLLTDSSMKRLLFTQRILILGSIIVVLQGCASLGIISKKNKVIETYIDLNASFWDLRRYYNDDAAFVKHINDQTDSGGNSFGVQASQDKIYIPIPQAEIDVNPNLVQNPGY